MTKKISILGCGWLGLPLASQLVQQGWKVNGSTTSPDKLDQLTAIGIRPFLLTVGDQVAGEKMEAFFNSGILIINIPPGRRDAAELKLYLLKIRAITEKALEGSIPKILFVSSTSVYPDTNSVITELTPAVPATVSGKAILEAEQYLKTHPDLQLVILRMAGLVGGERRPGRWFAGKSAIPNGLAPVNLVHRDDCIAVIIQLLTNDRWGATYNVCADKHPSKAEFYTQQAKLEGLELPQFQLNKTDGFKIISNEKLIKELGYQFKYSDPMKFEF